MRNKYKMLWFSILALLINSKVIKAQRTGVADPQMTFINMRNTDFTKLVGLQEGGRINYNSEKANAEGSGGFSIKSRVLVQIGGSIGTTSNLADLFKSDVQPSYTSSLTVHFLLPGSTWFYDGTLGTNIVNLNSPTQLNLIVPTDANGNNLKYTYTQKFQTKILTGKYVYNPLVNLYTCKRFFWISLAGLYDNTKYQFYSSSNIFSKQLFEEHYTAGSAKAVLNYYISWNKTDIDWRGWRPEFLYLNVGFKYGLGNNIQQLKKTTVTDISYSVADSNTVRQVTKTNNAYQGLFKEFMTAVPSAEIIISPVKAFALDLFGDYNLISASDKKKYNVENFLSLAAGIYYYGSEETSKINIGLYYKWTKNGTKSWKDEIGIKINLPITPIF